MRIEMRVTIAWVILTAAPALATDGNTVPLYLGQEPPGLVPQVFAPGVVSLPQRGESNICFTRDGRECYFNVSTASKSRQILVSQYKDGHWTPPAPASFSDDKCYGPCLADNDRSVYFIHEKYTIWKVRRTGQGWSQPEVMPAPVNLKPDANGNVGCDISSLGNMWICSWREGGLGQCDLWRLRFEDGQFTEPKNQLALNSDASDCAAVPGPDEKYVILRSNRPGGIGNGDLYIAFADGKGGWTSPKNLGPAINTPDWEDAPSLSPDGKYLFFSRNVAGEGSIYWVSVQAFLSDPIAALPSVAADSNTAPLYLGQEPPGRTPKIFAPGLVSAPKRFEGSICLSQDGRECYFRVRAANWSTSQIMVTRFENGQWSSPALAPFSTGRSSCPSLADNDQTLYFCRDLDICRVRRTTQGWSQPEALAAPANSPKEEFSCHVSSLGNLWTCSWRPDGVGKCDLWRVKSADGKFNEAQNLRNLNTPELDCSPVPGPNETYVVFSADRPGGLGGMDLYISFPDGQGGWTTPKNLGSAINSPDHETSPYLSPDQKYFFFVRETPTEADVYWVGMAAFLSDMKGGSK